MLKGRGRQLSFGQVVLEASCLMVHEKKIGNLEERLGIALRRSLGELKKKKKEDIYISLIYVGIVYSINPINPKNKTKKATNSK